jgi:hypothetical protein
MATKKAKIDMMSGVQSAGLGIAGGVAASYAANFLEKQSFMAGKQQYVPPAVALLGIAAMILVPNKMVQQVGLGMAISAGTESVERMILGSTAVNGVPPTPRGLGYTPQFVPDYVAASQTKTADGIVVK